MDLVATNTADAGADPDFFQRIRIGGEPKANPAAIVISGSARFTVLTTRLLRLEWSENGAYEDQATFAFPNRYAPAPEFASSAENGALIIDTGALRLSYKEGAGPFTPENLSISLDLNGETVTWRPGMVDRQNLRGTRRTLDRNPAWATLEQGLVSRSGWALYDDSHSPLLSDSDRWVAGRPDNEVQDWYFFGYGHDYKTALAEYTLFGGPIPLIPRFVLGAWWSRYWAYSADDLKALAQDFRSHDLPLDVLVLDMDWHTPDAWTGYTWNRKLFPDPAAFLAWVHEQGLRVTLNLHPAEGVQAFEEIYPRFAKAMGIDPASKEPVQFNITSRQFTRNYFELLHHPMEDEGVDFWWLDWQQGDRTEIKNLDPLIWLNHLHFQDSTRRGMRPLLYSRWGGLGNHRYPIGFSGDTYATWEALQFQPYFTATAANVGFGWWSHDIGGHIGATDPELYARWVQYGALSPCLRLHSTNDPAAERRPWAFPDDVFQAAKAAFHLRYQLVPYLYSAGREATDSAISLCRPMYYEYPEHEDAYLARSQYFLGDNLIAAPITQPADPQSGLASVTVWIPEGTWIDYQTLETFTGPRWVNILGGLDRIPLLVRAGAILPLAELASTTDAIDNTRLILSVFSGPASSYSLYEDDAHTNAYRQDQFQRTELKTETADNQHCRLIIAPTQGQFANATTQRSYEVRFLGVSKPDTVTLAGQALHDWAYDEQTLTATIQIPPHDRSTGMSVEIAAQQGLSVLVAARNQTLAQTQTHTLTASSNQQLSAHTLAGTDQRGRTDALAGLVGPLTHIIEFTTPEDALQHLGAVIVDDLSADNPAKLDITWTLDDFNGKNEQTIQLADLTTRQILYSPWNLDDVAPPARWSVAVQLTGSGKPLIYSHTSKAMFPAVSAWNVAVYQKDAADSEVVAHGPTDLNWKLYQQNPATAENVNEPFHVFLADRHSAPLQPGQALAAYATTTVYSPDNRKIVLELEVAGRISCQINGEPGVPVTIDHLEPREPMMAPWHEPDRQLLAFDLHEGANEVRIELQTGQQKYAWGFGAIVRDETGAIMTGVRFPDSANTRAIS